MTKSGVMIGIEILGIASQELLSISLAVKTGLSGVSTDKITFFHGMVLVGNQDLVLQNVLVLDLTNTFGSVMAETKFTTGPTAHGKNQMVLVGNLQLEKMELFGVPTLMMKFGSREEDLEATGNPTTGPDFAKSLAQMVPIVWA